MAGQSNIWLFFGLVPIVMATYIFGFDSKPLDSAENENIPVVSVLVQQVKELQEIVKKQGQHIEALETRITDLESSKTSDEAKEKPTIHAKYSESKIKSGDPTLPEASRGEKRGSSERSDKHLQGQPTQRTNRGIRSSDERVAFSAYLDHQVIDMGVGQTVKFNQVLLNDGSGYDTRTGAFTAPTSGVYFFIFYIHDYKDKAKVKLVVDNVLAVSAVLYTPSEDSDLTASNTAILQVNAGQEVWVESYGYNDSDLRSDDRERYVSFSGFLIY